MRITLAAGAAAAALGLYACTDDTASRGPGAGDAAASTAPATPRAAAVDEARLLAAEKEPGQWMSYGRTYDEQRFSPLDQIDDEQRRRARARVVRRLRDQPRPGGHAALRRRRAVRDDGVEQRVRLRRAPRARQLWRYDPEVPREWAVERLLRRRQPRRRRVERQGLRRHARRPADRARRGDRQGSLGRPTRSTARAATRSRARRAS